MAEPDTLTNATSTHTAANAQAATAGATPTSQTPQVLADWRSAGWQMLGSAHYALGESPFWHADDNALYWVDIPGKQVLRAHIPRHGNTVVQAWDMPSEPGCIAPAESGGLVIALRHGVFRARTWGGALEPITTLPYDPATVRANDGKCDALGRFWVGTIDEPKARRAAELFSIDCHAGTPKVQRQAGDALTANGLAWSPDNRTLYWADTPSHVVHAWDYHLQSNTLSAHRIHLQFEAKPADWTFAAGGYRGRPDGAAVDVLGNYWVSLFEGQRIACYAPDGSLLREIATPAQCPTMPCFGGDDLQTLYITTARHGRSPAELAAFPDSGAVFYLRVDTPGLPVNGFVD